MRSFTNFKNGTSILQVNYAFHLLLTEHCNRTIEHHGYTIYYKHIDQRSNSYCYCYQLLLLVVMSRDVKPLLEVSLPASLKNLGQEYDMLVNTWVRWYIRGSQVGTHVYTHGYTCWFIRWYISGYTCQSHVGT